MANAFPEAPAFSMSFPLPLPLPPGFRFKPSEEDLLSHYLRNKKPHLRPSYPPDLIREIDLYAHDPADLPEIFSRFAYATDPSEKRWYFFVPRVRENRSRRKAKNGFWRWRGRRGKATVVLGKKGEVLGMKRTFRFYRRRSSPAFKTNWIMKEYQLIDADSLSAPAKDSFVLCYVFHKSHAKKKLRKHESCSYDEDNLAATFSNDNGNPSEFHDRALIPGNREVVGEESTRVVGDELHRFLMESLYEPDNTVALESVYGSLPPERILQFDLPVEISNESMNEQIDQAMLEGNFIELNDLLSPLPVNRSRQNG